MSQPKRRLALLLVIASSAGCAGNNLAYDLLFGAMQPHYTSGGANEWDQKRDFDERVDAWREHKKIDGEGE